MNKRSLLLIAPLLFCLPLLASADEQWEFTTTIQSSSMPMQIPPTTRTVCVADGQYDKPSEKMVPTEGNCKVSNFKISGNTSSFHVECPAPNKMSGDGSFTRKSSSAYNGNIAMKGDFGDGKQSDMRMSFDGKKLGPCQAQKQPDYMAMANAQIGAACGEAVNSMQKEMFIGPYAPEFCQKQKPKFCAKVKSFLAAANDPEQLRNIAEQRADWAELADSCGLNSVAMQQAACSKAKTTSNWGAVARFCPADEARLLAREHCTGRRYTELMTGEYGPLCQAFSDEVKAGSDSKSSGGVMDGANKALDGLNKLRGLFGK